MPTIGKVDMSAISKSRAAKCADPVGICGLLLLIALNLAPVAVYAQDLAVTNEAPFSRAERLLRGARLQWQAGPTNPELAWHVSRASFDAAEFAPSDAVRAERADEGISAARKALALDPNLAPGHYYLGMNLGQLARTKRLGALKLVGELESSFFRVIKLNPGFDFAGAYRCLGLLYRDAPGWPISVGNRGKARQYLTKAVELSPEYPDNWISLIEAYLAWGERERARKHLEAAEEHLKPARKRFTGVEWKASWEDWDKRLETIRSKLRVEKLESPKAAE
jgi:tetratricopeptide (TPR) repeat protein